MIVFGVELDKLENDDDVRFVVPCEQCGVARVFTAQTFDGGIDKPCTGCSSGLQSIARIREIELVLARLREIGAPRFAIMNHDALRCSQCGVEISGPTLAATLPHMGRKYNADRMHLSDECQRLKDENTRLHAELSRAQRGRK